MAKRLTDKKRKLILADYITCQNYSEVARKHGLSPNGVKKIVLADPASAAKCAQKQEENTQDVLAFMDSQRDTKKRVLIKLMQAMEQKAENIDMFTNIKDLATAYGILVDKEFKYIEVERAKQMLNEPIEIILRRGNDEDKN